MRRNDVPHRIRLDDGNLLKQRTSIKTRVVTTRELEYGVVPHE